MLTKTKITDFEKENKKHRRLGARGEEIVLKAERDSLRKIGKNILVNGIIQISEKNPSAGYDIFSFEADGQKKCIEVKSTNYSPSSKANFLITINEYEKSKALENYYIYIVFNAKSKNPKIWRLRDPFSFQGKGLTITPVSFRVEISTLKNDEVKGR